MSDQVKDKDGYVYKFPERDCKKCKKYPCIKQLDKLFSNFAKYGCRNYIEQTK